ncbi:MAG TPA: hypothetical protein VG733_10685, partial [Chthoniobacteraceae bacterium]|nr:hypothetical protein [Chthoniobacteraceae bacterium]
GASASPAPARDATGGIEKVVAEGNVTIDSDRPDPNGGATVHYSGKGTKVDYNPATGEMVLSGMPELQKDMDELVATDESTVIFLNRDGMMDAKGPHKIKIVDPGPDKSPTPKPSKTPEITLPTPQQ